MKKKLCPRCIGTGKILQDSDMRTGPSGWVPCPKCNGTGKINHE